ncbi:putative transmembrane protein [Toxoplasma gondii MAS]|uniref:Putative transmembrane protein n=1 Tax=Toxoplasma gondii MAS TaxID=943118 RepID=A0A086QVK8_TOXGO|nr:putative transmembrane protein [Toxoplasma gondii MAS]
MQSVADSVAVLIQFIAISEPPATVARTPQTRRRRGGRARLVRACWNASVFFLFWCLATWAQDRWTADLFIVGEGADTNFPMVDQPGGPADRDGVAFERQDSGVDSGSQEVGFDFENQDFGADLGGQDGDTSVRDGDQRTTHNGALSLKSPTGGDTQSEADLSGESSSGHEAPKQGEPPEQGDPPGQAVIPQAPVANSDFGYRGHSQVQAAPCVTRRCPYYKQPTEVVEEENVMRKKPAVVSRKRQASEWYYGDEETTTSKVLRGVGYGWMAFMVYAIMRHGMSNERREPYYYEEQ